MTEHTHEHDGHEHITIIDEEGNILYEDAKDPLTGVTKFRHGFSGGQKDNKKWGILKSDGTWLVHPTYDYIKLL